MRMVANFERLRLVWPYFRLGDNIDHICVEAIYKDEVIVRCKHFLCLFRAWFFPFVDARRYLLYLTFLF